MSRTEPKKSRKNAQNSNQIPADSAGFQVEPGTEKEETDQKGKRWLLVVHGAAPEDCPILKLLVAQFEKDCYPVAALAYQTGKHGIHPHWQGYFQTTECCRMRKHLVQVLGQTAYPYVVVAKKTRRACLAYVYAVHKQHEIGWVHYLKGAEVPRDYKPYKTANLLWLRDNMKPWQAEITRWVTTTADYRTLYWIHQPVGNTGKSYLCKYLHYFHGAILTGGSVGDMKHAIARWNQITGHYPITILLDVARSDQLKECGFKGLEEIKNAMFFSGKYQSTMVASCLPPNVVVFSNAPPETRHMSLDRWCIYRICPHTYTLIPETLPKKKRI